MKLYLKELRERAGKTQQEVADHLGVNLTRYGNWERGYREMNVIEAIKIAKFLNCTLDEMTGHDPDLDEEDNTPYPLSSNECKLIELYRSTDNRGKHAIMAVAESQRGDTCIPKINKAINA